MAYNNEAEKMYEKINKKNCMFNRIVRGGGV